MSTYYDKPEFEFDKSIDVDIDTNIDFNTDVTLNITKDIDVDINVNLRHPLICLLSRRINGLAKSLSY